MISIYGVAAAAEQAFARAFRVYFLLTIKITHLFGNPTPPQPLEIMARNLREGVGLGPT